MNGADLMFDEALRLGIDICFANPGTTEMPMVAALDRAQGMRAVLGLHENVCTGAADGYARIAGKPALTLLHLGPGLANGLANLHNAKRAFSPVINLIGEHASWHLSADPPLASDIEGLARPVSDWVRRITTANSAARDYAEAHNAAISRRGSVSTLIFPHDHQLAQAQPSAFRAKPPETYGTNDSLGIEQAARLLRKAHNPLLLLGGNALFGAGLISAGKIAEACNGTLAAEVGFAKLETGRGLPVVKRLPYFPELAQQFLDNHDAVIVCGTKMPVSFFGYHDKPSRYLDHKSEALHLANQTDDAAQALAMLALTLAVKDGMAPVEASIKPATTGKLDPETIGQNLASLQPEGAIVVLTAVTSAHAYSALAPHARPHTQLALTGGAIGDGPSLALGAAMAAPDKRVVNLEADGSGAYILQALWSQARENLDITTVICANRKYNILEVELARAGISDAGPKARQLCSLENPSLDWVSLAKGFGVPAVSVETPGAFAKALECSFSSKGPFLIEAVI